MARLRTCLALGSPYTSFMQPGLTPLPQSDPEILKRIEQSDPAMGESMLLNGARFLSASVTGYPISSIAIHFDAGSKREGPADEGALHFYEHLPPAAFRIESKGVDLMRFAESRFWQIKISTSDRQLTFGIDCPDFDAGDAMVVLRDIMNYNADRYRQVFPVEKERILNEITQRENHAGISQYDFVRQLLMRSTGFAHSTIGTREQVTGYTFEKILELGNRYLSPQNATVAISGTPEVIAAAHGFFEHMPFRGSGPSQAPVDLSKRPQWQEIPEVSKHVTGLNGEVETGLIFPGLIGLNRREMVVLELLVKEFGLAASQKLSHESGLTYSAWVSQLKFEEFGFIALKFNVSPKKMAQAISFVRDLLEEFPKKIGEEMIQAAYIRRRNTIYSCAANGNHGAQLGVLAAEPKLEYLSGIQELNTLKSLAVDELRAAASRYLDFSKVKFVFHGTDERLSQIVMP